MNDATLGGSASTTRSYALDIRRVSSPLLHDVPASPDARRFAERIWRAVSDGVAETGQLTYE